MTSQKFPEYMYEIVNLGGETELGTITIDDSGELTAHLVSMIFYRTDLFTNEGVRLRLVRSNIPATPVYSDWVTPASAISNFTDTNYWVGDLKFDFAREQLKASTTCQIFLETQNYTHDYSGTQLGVILNYINASTGQFDVLPTNGFYQTQFAYR